MGMRASAGFVSQLELEIAELKASIAGEPGMPSYPLLDVEELKNFPHLKRLFKEIENLEI